MAKLHELFPSLLYLPDLGSSDWLFLGLNNMHQEKRFLSNDEIIVVSHRCRFATDCTALEGTYVKEQIKIEAYIKIFFIIE